MKNNVPLWVELEWVKYVRTYIVKKLGSSFSKIDWHRLLLIMNDLVSKKARPHPPQPPHHHHHQKEFVVGDALVDSF